MVEYELTTISKAYKAIQEAKTVDELKDIRDKAEAMRAYTKQIGESLETQNACCEIKLRAERRMGEMLKEIPREQGARTDITSDQRGLKSTLKDINVSESTSKRYQKIAGLPDNIFETLIKDIKEEGNELTEAFMVSTAKKIERAETINQQRKAIETGELKLPEGLFEVIVIDPPWAYGTQDKYDPLTRRGTTPYPEMETKELAKLELPVNRDGCVLWLWTTHQFMLDARMLMGRWGFEYKCILTWDKEKLGIGKWLRLQTEFCLLGVCGKPFWNLTNERDIIREPRREHSRKPDKFYSMVDILCVGRKLDYFAREKRQGWDVYGSEWEKFNKKDV